MDLQFEEMKNYAVTKQKSTCHQVQLNFCLYGYKGITAISRS